MFMFIDLIIVLIKWKSSFRLTFYGMPLDRFYIPGRWYSIGFSNCSFHIPKNVGGWSISHVG